MKRALRALVFALNISFFIGTSSLLNYCDAQTTKVNTPIQEYKYQQKILRKIEIEKYERSLLPESGFMTREEYEIKSKDTSRESLSLPEYKAPQDIKMKYIPQPIYKLVRYNDPPGSVELHVQRKFYFNRQINLGGITSPNKDILVYPVLYYYAANQCSASDLFVIPLDKTLPDVERISRSNIIKRNPAPILSTVKDISEKFIIRTLTPVDFSPDGSKLAVKEKIGSVNDGIWKTNLWVYDFKTQQAKELLEVREAIKFYWMNSKNLILDEKRWDIIPLGFDAQDPQRIIVSAYGYTGKTPKFLGNWSIDCNGERSMLVSLFNPSANLSINGFKLVQSGVINPAQVYADEKKQNKQAKANKKQAKKTSDLLAKEKKQLLKNKLKEMKLQESNIIKKYNDEQKKNHNDSLN